jgi:hypothetical protein
VSELTLSPVAMRVDNFGREWNVAVAGCFSPSCGKRSPRGKRSPPRPFSAQASIERLRSKAQLWERPVPDGDRLAFVPLGSFTAIERSESQWSFDSRRTSTLPTLS